MADLGIYNTQQVHQDEKTEESFPNIPAIVIHGDIEGEKDDPPPYSEDLNDFQETTTAVVEFSHYQDTDNINQEFDLPDLQDEGIDEVLDEEDILASMTLSPLERLLKFSGSSVVLQRLVVTRELSHTIQHEICLEDAVVKALPIIKKLGKDADDSVREALAGDLDKIMCFYYENAPPLLTTAETKDDSSLHIPANAFADTVIDFLLDQNTTLASIAQQSIVVVASGISSPDLEPEMYESCQNILEHEIYRGIILGLMRIVQGENEAKDIATLSEEENEESSDISTMISSATSSVLKQYDDGGVNLAKMVCLMLISALAHTFGSKGCTEKFLPIVESMISDSMFYVRKEAAAAISSLSAAVDPKVTLEKLLPIYTKLSTDSIWHVRRACVFALPFLCQVLPEDIKVTTAVEGFELFKNDVSRNVRNSLADVTGEVISKFLPEDWKETGNPGKVPEELLEFFLSFGDASVNSNQMFKMDTERVHNFAFNFPAVVLTAGVEYWDSHLKDTYLNLTKDYQLKVRRTFAYSLHDIARIIGPERTERDLVQIFALYLMDLDDVKQGVLEHLSEFLSVLAISSRNEYIPILAEVWDGVRSNWHLRDILARQLRDIAELFDASRVVEHILPLAIRACHDDFAAVRETSVDIFPIILDVVKRAVDTNGENLSQIDDDDSTEDMADRQEKYALALLSHVMERLHGLATSPKYRTRLVFVQICRSLLEAGISSDDFGSFFLPKLISLSRDPVVNVRISTSITMKTLLSLPGYYQQLECTTLTDESPEDGLNSSKILDNILYHLTIDKDRDVAHYISEFITPERLEEYQKRKVIPEIQAIEESKILEQNQARVTPFSPNLSSPPIPPAHLITVKAPDHQGENSFYNEEIYHSTDSPMDIVDEYDDIEDMSLTIDAIDGDIYVDANEDQAIPYKDIHSRDKKVEDELMTETPVLSTEEEDEEEFTEKAHHVFLSKVPAQIIVKEIEPSNGISKSN